MTAELNAEQKVEAVVHVVRGTLHDIGDYSESLYELMRFRDQWRSKAPTPGWPMEEAKRNGESLKKEVEELAARLQKRLPREDALWRELLGTKEGEWPRAVLIEVSQTQGWADLYVRPEEASSDVFGDVDPILIRAREALDRRWHELWTAISVAWYLPDEADSN